MPHCPALASCPGWLPLEEAGEWAGACFSMSPTEQTSCKRLQWRPQPALVLLGKQAWGVFSPHSQPGEEGLSMTTGPFLGLGGVRRLMLPGSSGHRDPARQLCLNSFKKKSEARPV